MSFLASVMVADGSRLRFDETPHGVGDSLDIDHETMRSGASSRDVHAISIPMLPPRIRELQPCMTISMMSLVASNPAPLL